MRFVTQVLLGLIVFNAMLVMTSPFFSTAYVSEEPYDAINVTGNETTYAQYEDFNLDFWGILFGSGGQASLVMGGSLIIGIAVAWGTKSMIPIGIAAFIGIITSLYLTARTVLYGLPYNSYVQGTISLVLILISITLLFIMSEAMMSQTGAD